MGKVSRFVDLEVLEPSPERLDCLAMVDNELFDIDDRGINYYFDIRERLEETCSQMNIIETLDVSFESAMNFFLTKCWYNQPGQLISFDLSKVEAIFLEVTRRYARSDIGASAASTLFRAYRAQNAKDRGLQVLGEIAYEHPNSSTGDWAFFYRSQIENNWQRTISFKEFKKRYQRRQ